MNISIVIILVAYIAVTVAFAFVMAKHNRTTNDMLNAGGSLGVAVIVPLLLSEAIGGSGTVGSATEAMSSIGMAAVWTVWGVAIGYFAYRLFLSRFYHVLYTTRGVTCIPKAYGIRFDTKTRLLMLTVVSIVYFCFFSLQPVAAAAVIAPMFGVSRSTTIVVLGVLFVIISCVGGLKGLASANKMHSFVLIVGMAAVAIAAIRYAGGWNSIVEAVPENYMNPFHTGPRQVLTWIVTGMLAQLSSAILTTIVTTGKSYKDVKWGIDITCILLLIFAFFPVLIGIVGRAVMPDVDPATALYSVSARVSPIMGGIAVVAVLAAIFSSAPAFLLVVTNTFMQDVYHGFINPKATEKQSMLVSKVFTAVVGLVAVYMATRITSIFNETIKILQIRAVAAITLLVSLVWPRVDARAGFWSILCGGIVAAVWYFMDNPPFTSEPLIPSVIVGLLVLIVLTLMSREKVSKGYQTYMDLKEEYDKIEG